jgi:hypothetical protein
MASKSEQDKILDKILQESDKKLPLGTKGVAAGKSGQAMTPEERQQQSDDIEKYLRS